MGQKRKPAVQRQNGVSNRPEKRSKVVDPKNSTTSLLFAPRPDWHAHELPSVFAEDVKSLPPRATIDALQKYADTLLQAENVSYAASQASKSSQNKFLSEIMSSGTLEDKVSALTLLVQESPVHATKAFENLLGLSRKKSRNQALMAVAALKDLLGQGVLLPTDRKLRAFANQPALLSALQGKSEKWASGDALPGRLQKVHLIVWAYEDWLKRSYFELLQILETWCADEVEYARNRAVTYVWELLRDKPEQEENLLRLLVNKLGDTDRKIASKASHLLLQLQNSHPAMKTIIISAVEADCLFRPGQSLHAKYYAIITLNQTVLSQKEPEVANKLLDIYFSLFIQMLKPMEQQQKSQQDSRSHAGNGKAGRHKPENQRGRDDSHDADSQLRERMTAQVLTGVNRAFPFADTADSNFEKQMDTIFRVTHSANFNTSVQALILIQQISSTKHYNAERFYRTLYESLLDPRSITSSKQVMYLNLLYRSLKNDLNAKRVQAFIKRILQVVTMHEPPFACGVLYLIKELEGTFPSIRQMMKQAELGDQDEEEHFVDVPGDNGDAETTGAPAARSQTDTALRYDPKKRDPEYAHAERSCLWEVLPLLQHFHPSVSLFADSLLFGRQMPPKPDSTQHTLTHFLDRFVYRNAKTKPNGTHGTSIMQPMAGSAAADLLIVPGKDFARNVHAPLNPEQFWQKKVEDVAADEVFFHSYFNQAGNRKRAQTEREKREEAKSAARDADVDSDNEDEDEIWNALVNSRPDIEGPDEDDDLSIEDLEDAYSDSDAESGSGIDLGGDAAGKDDALHSRGFGGDSDVQSDLEELPELDDDDDAFWDDDDEIPADVAPDDGGMDVNGTGSKGTEKRKQRKKLKSLPIFASVEDYEKILQNEPDASE